MTDRAGNSRDSMLEPNNYSFVIEGKLAGMSRPTQLEENIYYLATTDNVGLIVSLTETSPDTETIRRISGMEHLHLPIQDYKAPTIEQISTFVSSSREIIQNKKKAVVAHCAGGYGRTGTMLACYLVSEGCTAENAIDQVRTKRPGSIGTEQENIITEWERVVKQSKEKKKEDGK